MHYSEINIFQYTVTYCVIFPVRSLNFSLFSYKCHCTVSTANFQPYVIYGTDNLM